MEVRARSKYVSISPQKLRLVCDQVRGMNAEAALVALRFMPQKGATFVAKTVESALANAENNFELSRENLVIKTIYADGGPMLKRFKAGARGRYKPRKRRTSHLMVVLSDNSAQSGAN
ncbi:50S ribosomal protein L22 [Anaerolineae bacterium CFX9]|jgi:large subunit ribosomal protein L22|nr:50S ribosomal protein L22 [Anaerolineae bacterium CFX9]